MYGYKGKQVRDNVDSGDLVQCFWHFYRDPKLDFETIDLIVELTGYEVAYSISRGAIGGHLVDQRCTPVSTFLHGVTPTICV